MTESKRAERPSPAGKPADLAPADVWLLSLHVVGGLTLGSQRSA